MVETYTVQVESLSLLAKGNSCCFSESDEHLRVVLIIIVTKSILKHKMEFLYMGSNLYMIMYFTILIWK